MTGRIIEKLASMGVWQLVWVTVLVSEVFTAIMNIIMSFAWWGRFSPDLVMIGTVDAFVVSLVAAYVMISILKRSENEVRMLNAELETQVDERTAELKESEADYRMLMEQASDAIFIGDTGSNILVVNPKACEMLGYTQDELIRLNAEDILVKDEIPEFRADKELVVSGKTVVAERTGLCKDGATVPVEISAKKLEDGRILAIVRDITNRKKAEEEKERIQAQLIDMHKMEAIGRLAGGVAHDFNNMLTVIKGDCELALEGMDNGDPLHPHLSQIQKAAQRAADLTRKLLLFSRQKPMNSAYIDLNRTVEEMLGMLRRLIGEDIEIGLELEPGLQSVFADPVNMEQVIMNLVVNARDAMPEGGKLDISTINLTVNETDCKSMPEARPGRFVRLTVADTGKGIVEEDMRRIFDPFYSNKETGKGTGLGLSVVYGIVKQHCGWIDVKSRPGQGTAFAVYLEGFSKRPEDEPGRPFQERERRGSGERILLVEDEEGVSKFISMMLKRNGYAVFHASDAEEAVELFGREKGNFHLVLSDVVLPGKSGVQLIEELQSVKPGLPVLFCSGYTDQKSQWPAISGKGFRFIEKPFTREALLKAVRESI